MSPSIHLFSASKGQVMFVWSRRAVFSSTQPTATKAENPKPLLTLMFRFNIFVGWESFVNIFVGSDRDHFDYVDVNGEVNVSLIFHLSDLLIDPTHGHVGGESKTPVEKFMLVILILLIMLLVLLLMLTTMMLLCWRQSIQIPCLMLKKFKNSIFSPFVAKYSAIFR